VAYYKLVLQPLKSIKRRPTYSQYLQGRRKFFDLTRLMARPGHYCLAVCYSFCITLHKTYFFAK